MEENELWIKIREFYLRGGSDDLFFKITLTPFILAIIITGVLFVVFIILTFFRLISIGAMSWLKEISNTNSVMISKEEYQILKQNNDLYIDYIKDIPVCYIKDERHE